MHELSELQSLLVETANTLCGYVCPQLRAVKVDLDEYQKSLYFWFIYDGEISEADEEKIDLIVHLSSKFVELDVKPPYNVVKTLQRVDYPHALPEQGYYVYLRDESLFKGRAPIVYINSDTYFNKSLSDKENLHLTSLYALLGNVRPNLRHFSFAIDELKRIAYFYFYVDGEISDLDKAIAQKICTTAIAKFYEEYQAKSEINQVDSTLEALPIGIVVYSRDESALKDDSEHETSDIKKWINLETGSQVLRRERLFSCANLIKRIRNVLVSQIRPTWRSIQFSVNQLKRIVRFWLHLEGKIDQGTVEIVQWIKIIASKAEFNAEVYAEQLDTPSPIPRFGQFLFMRDETDLGIPTPYSDESACIEQLQRYIATNLKGELRQNLRSIQFGVCNLDKEFFMLFVLSNTINSDETKCARELVDKVKQTFFPKYSSVGYSACYETGEQLPSIGFEAYLSQTEKRPPMLAKEHFIQSVTNSLIGKISDHHRAIKVEFNESRKITYYWFYYNCEISDSEKHFGQMIAQSTCPKGYTSQVVVEHVPYTTPIPSIGQCIYMSYRP